MAVKRQPEFDGRELCESVNDWFRMFLKHIEISMAETGQGLPPDASADTLRLAALRAVKSALLDSGVNDHEIADLFGQVAIEKTVATETTAWSPELNKRRFELIDMDIQGTLSRVEKIELAGLTRLMREFTDSESNLPFEGARALHRRLMQIEANSTGTAK